MLSLLLLLAAPAQADHPPGTSIDPAVTVDITAQGFESLDAFATSLIPDDLLAIPIPELGQSDSADEDCIDLWFDKICWIPWWYGFDIGGFDTDINIDFVNLVPTTDKIVLDAQVTFAISSSGDPGHIDFWAGAADVDLFGLEFEVLDINESCNVWLEPTPIGFGTALTLIVDTSVTPPAVEVDVAPIDLSVNLEGLEITGCAIDFLDDFVDAVNDFIGIFSLDIYELLTDLITPVLDGFVDDFLVDIEAQLQELVASLVIEETLDLLGTELTLKVAPSEVVIRDEGLRFALAGSVEGSGLPDPCVSRYGITTSKATGSGPPPIGGAPEGIDHALAAIIDDDIINQALFAAWYEGLLCFELASGGDLPIDLPIPIDTSLLRILGGAEFEELFPEPAPIILATAPATPPEAVTLDNGVGIDLRDLGLNLYAGLEHRQVRLVGMDIGADIDVGVPFDATNGVLGVDLDLSSDAFTFEVVFNELKPEASAGIQDGLGGLFDTLVGGLVGGLLGDLSFPLPGIAGLGISDVTVTGAGPGADQLGIFASLGPVDYDNGDVLTDGCAGGCGEGCAGGGCSQGGLPATPLFLMIPVLVGLRRRSTSA